MSKISYNGAGYRPEIEDVWLQYDDEKPVREMRTFVNHFIAYAQSRDEVRNQALAEIEYNYDETV